jgi:hypothetical protein
MMKRFIDDKGVFEIEVPVTWKYTLHDEYIHSFEEYETWTTSDCFQLSIKKVKDDEEKNMFIDLLGYLPSTEINKIDYRSYEDNESDEDSLIAKTWTTLIYDTIILFSFIYDKDGEIKLNEKPLDEKLKMVYSVISSFNLIEERERKRKLNSYRFEMFLQGIGASNVILKKAIDNKAFIEATCVLANQIDSLLRIGIVLKRQLINNNDKIEREWIYQGKLDKKKSEKDIYIKAKELDIINEEICDKLFSLYEDRNRVIHRFIISEITLAEVESISYFYYEVREKIKLLIDDIESEQIRLNIGMTTIDDKDLGIKSHQLKIPIGKIGKLNYFEEKEKD